MAFKPNAYLHADGERGVTEIDLLAIDQELDDHGKEVFMIAYRQLVDGKVQVIRHEMGFVTRVSMKRVLEERYERHEST